MWRAAVFAALVLPLLVLTATPGSAVARSKRTVSNGTHVSGPISASTTWTTAGSPYVIDGDINVLAGATLTIDPGVVVKFNGAVRALRVTGTLRAVGSQGNEIVFTSVKDDSVGGDSNGDNGLTQPSFGDWSSICFSAGTASALRYVTVRYGGSGTSDSGYGAIEITGTGTSVTIADATITRNQRSGIRIYRGSGTISSSTIAQNGNGVSVNWGTAVIDRTTVMANAVHGIWLNLPNIAPLPPASFVTNSDIKRNAGAGIYMRVNGDYPIPSMPHGNWNNIFSNNAGGPQLVVVGYPGFRNAAVDWKYNYWGSDVAFASNQPVCPGTSPNAEGGLVYSSSASDPKAGPLDNGLYYFATGTTVKCGYDPFKILLGEFSPTYLPTAGRLALGATELAFAPELRYDSFETYHADSASTITNNYTETYANLLLTRDYGYLAASDPSYLSDDLTLDYLGRTYPSSLPGTQTASPDDYIDEVNNYAEDAQRLHALPQYANRTYARFFDLDDGSVIVQYWFFYYYNPKTYFGFGAHEGDWEMIQVYLDPSGMPINATYSQHNDHERCDWSVVPRAADGRPAVYVAEGSHANYFSAGYHPGGDDTADGNGEWVSPLVVDVTGGAGWLAWPGRWGASTGGTFGAESPVGPAQKGAQWSDPLAWQATVNDCTEPSALQIASNSKRIAEPWVTTPAASHTLRPPLPRIDARLSGKTVIIRYTFRTPLPEGKSRRPWLLLTAVKSAGRRYVPLTKRTLIREPRGRIVQSVGIGPPPFKLLVAVVARDGRRSRSLVFRLKDD